MIHVYAFVERLERLPDVAGIGASPIEQHGTGVAAIVSRHADVHRGDPRVAAVAHGRVVEALTGLTQAVLPVRFGETFGDQSELADVMRGREAQIRAALEHVRGCVELGVRVAGEALQRPATVAADGTDYMKSRLALLAERDAITHGLHERLETQSRASVRTERGGFEASYLVERECLEAAQETVRGFAAAHPELTVVCTGPWAPYSFGGAAA